MFPRGCEGRWRLAAPTMAVAKPERSFGPALKISQSQSLASRSRRISADQPFGGSISIIVSIRSRSGKLRVPMKKQIVLYDNECSLCTFQMKVLSWLDWFNVLAL